MGNGVGKSVVHAGSIPKGCHAVTPMSGRPGLKIAWVFIGLCVAGLVLFVNRPELVLKVITIFGG